MTKQGWYEARRDKAVICYKTWWKRITYGGMDWEQALTMPAEEPKTQKGWYLANEHRARIGYETWRSRVKQGWPYEDALLTPKLCASGSKPGRAIPEKTSRPRFSAVERLAICQPWR